MHCRTMFTVWILLSGCAGPVQMAPIRASDRSSDATVDVRGKIITTYVAHAAGEAMAQLAPGAVLEIVTDSYVAMEPDLVAWARMNGHRLIAVDKEEEIQRFFVARGESTADVERKRFAMVLGQDGLEELLVPLGLALAAQLSGVDAHIYFMGPAVHLLKGDFEARLGGISAPFSSFARDGLAEAGHVPVRTKLRQLHELGATFYICAPSADHFGVKSKEVAYEGVVWSEYLTFIEVMMAADAQIFVQ